MRFSIKSVFVSIVSVSICVVFHGSTAGAQAVPDHMQCFRVNDATLRGLKGIVDLEAPSTGLAEGCKLGKAKLYCVPAKQSIEPGTLVHRNQPVSTLPYSGPPNETDRICYQLKCEAPNGLAANRTATDEFGTHELQKLRTELMCKPAVGGTTPPPRNGFQIRTPEIEIPAGYNWGQCYYFRTPNAVKIPVKRWSSEMGSITKRVALMMTTTDAGVPADKQPQGTLTLVDCDTVPDNGLVAEWVYSADTSPASLEMPANDGAGHPVAIEIPAHASGYLLMHHHNETAQDAKTQVTITAEALESPIYTKASTLSTYDSTIALPPMTNDSITTRSCDVPAGSRFFALTTLTHGHANFSGIYDGADLVFAAFDWRHPGTQSFSSPFLQFASGELTYACSFQNPHTFVLRTGESWQYDEQCVAVGYFFPATKPLRCVNGFTW